MSSNKNFVYVVIAFILITLAGAVISRWFNDNYYFDGFQLLPVKAKKQTNNP